MRDDMFGKQELENKELTNDELKGEEVQAKEATPVDPEQFAEDMNSVEKDLKEVQDFCDIIKKKERKSAPIETLGCYFKVECDLVYGKIMGILDRADEEIGKMSGDVADLKAASENLRVIAKVWHVVLEDSQEYIEKSRAKIDEFKISKMKKDIEKSRVPSRIESIKIRFKRSMEFHKLEKKMETNIKDIIECLRNSCENLGSAIVDLHEVYQSGEQCKEKLAQTQTKMEERMRFYIKFAMKSNMLLCQWIEFDYWGMF